MSPDHRSSSVLQLSRFRADLSRALSRRGRRLLEAADLRQQVRALEPLEAYFIIKELGVDDATPILMACTSEQLQAFVDLDCWRDDEPDADEIDAWLAPFASESLPRLARAFLSLDEELQTLFLADTLTIYEASDADNLPDPQEGRPRRQTPDTFFFVEAKPGVEREVEPLVLIEALYAADINTAFRLLTSARWELQSTLTDQALHFRTARVDAMGFPDRQRAQSIFAPPTAQARELYVPEVDDPTATLLPAPYAGPLGEGSLLVRALERISDPNLLTFLEEGLRNLINHAVVAVGGSPRDVAHASNIAARVRDTVSLGMEALLSPEGPLADPDAPETAAAGEELLRRWSVFDLFRHGHAQVRPLRDEALALARDPAVVRWRNTGDTEKADYGEDRMLRELFDALLESPPSYAGFDRLAPTRRRAFADKHDIEAAAEALRQLRRSVT